MMHRSALLLAATLSALSGGAAAQPIDLSACQFLTAHRPAAGVDHTPGVDVNGKAVAPADLPGSAGAAPPLERFDIPVTVDFARRMGFPVPQGGAAPGVEVGYLTWYANRLYFNGQPIGAPSEAEVYAYCRTVR
ncbi:hypothetical protein JJL56_13855 [Azospirillum sp. YIM DDC1]|uniref:Uncharacterized protein n=1 Tax=Azospirillum aestuarii TaxID=2802052 RepID=A0ABS1HYQ4_9PROT|nr:hypothetical protein [Azospirillum aestuarii]MBK3772921.1 hypothetical protein [Azospirillum brasilense]MBK4719958.1 hypothetical protein [Azospirillum aestuarii]TWA89886.1 hypothetical protein FBY14_105190 [Azospirillum brasilense]